jgi:hypothetical protein
LSHKEISQSYISNLQNNPDKVKNFQETFLHLDAIEAISIHIYQLHEKSRTEIRNKKNIYKNLTEEEVLSYCVRVNEEIRQNDPDFETKPLYELINECTLNFHQNKPTPAYIDYMQIAFIEPVKIKVFEKFRNKPQAMVIVNGCRKATWLYSEIESQSKTLGKDFERANINMLEAIKTLKELTKDII